MSVRYKNLLYPAHFYATFLNLMLSGFPTIKNPDISIKTKSKRRLVSC